VVPTPQLLRNTDREKAKKDADKRIINWLTNEENKKKLIFRDYWYEEINFLPSSDFNIGTSFRQQVGPTWIIIPYPLRICLKKKIYI